MRRAPAYVAMAIALAGPAAHAQLSDVASFQGASWEGIHLYGVNAFTSYVSSAYPLNTTQTVAPGATQLGYDLNYGVSAGVGWQYHHGEKTSVSVFYMGSYNRSENYSSLSSFGHSLLVNATWQLSQKWSLNFSGSGIYQTLGEYLFQPSALSVIAQTPTTATNLASTMGVGQFNNSQAASTLAGATAPTPQGTPATSLLVGDRILTYATQASLSFQATSRLSFNFSGVTAAGQNRTGGTSAIPAQTYVMPHSIGLNAGASMNYSLSPRTTIGLDVDGAWSSNHFQGAYATMAQGTLGRMMGLHWFLGGSGGVSFTKVIQQVSGAPKTRQIIGAGSVGYRLESQTFLASYNRTSQEASGFAIGTNTTFSGAWSWHPAGSRWIVFTSVGQQQLRNTGFVSLSGWSAAGGWGTHFGPDLRLTAQYVYAHNTGTYLGNATTVSVNSIRLTIGWVPQGVQAALQGAQGMAGSSLQP